MHAQQLASEEEAIAARKALVAAVFEWQAGSSAAAAPTVNVICDIIQARRMACLDAVCASKFSQTWAV